MTNRRTFLAQAGLVSAGMLAKPSFLKAMERDHVAGLQLYSLRDQLPGHVREVIPKVAIAGYKEVETFRYTKAAGFWGLDAMEFSKLLKNNGLSTPSGHFDFDMKGDMDELHTYIEAANITGMKYIVVPFLNGEFIKTVDDFKHIAEKFNKAGEICKQSGLKLGYHNHNFEWKPVDGTTFYDTLLKETDPALVSMEMDLYWVVRTGQDPVELIKTHPGRYFAFHIKDMDKANHNINTEVGKGTIDFKRIINYAKLAGVKHFIMEQENYIDIDPYVSITESCSYMKNVLHV